MCLLVGFVFLVFLGLGTFLAVVLYPPGESSDVEDPALLAELFEHWKTPTDTILVLSGCLGRKEGVFDCCCPIISLPWGWWVFFSGRQHVSLPSSLNMSEGREWGLRKEDVHSTWIRGNSKQNDLLCIQLLLGSQGKMGMWYRVWGCCIWKRAKE